MTASQLTPKLPTAADEHADDSSRKDAGDSFSKFRTVAKRLEGLYGTGDNAQLRRRLYQRIQLCAIEHGPECYEVIRSCVSSAQSANNPGRYFCVSVTSELKTLGYWEKPTDF